MVASPSTSARLPHPDDRWHTTRAGAAFLALHGGCGHPPEHIRIVIELDLLDLDPTTWARPPASKLHVTDETRRAVAAMSPSCPPDAQSVYGVVLARTAKRLFLLAQELGVACHPDAVAWRARARAATDPGIRLGITGPQGSYAPAATNSGGNTEAATLPREGQEPPAVGGRP